MVSRPILDDVCSRLATSVMAISCKDTADAAKARQIATFRQTQAKERALGAKGGRLTLESLKEQIAEGGVKGIDVPSWYAAMLPARTPPDVINKVYSEIAAIVVQPDVQAKLREQGLLPLANRPDEFAAQIKRETAVWARIIKEGGFKPE